MTENSNNTKPPLFKTWMGWYIFVLLFLVAEIALFYFLTNTFS